MYIKIRRVYLKDLPKIYNMERKVFNRYAFSKDILESLILKNYLFLKLEKNRIFKTIIGFVILVKDRADRLNLINFLIDPKYQRTGLGSILLRRTLKLIKKNEKTIRKIILNVNVKNAPAIDLYHKFGFKIKKKIKNYYQSKEDAYLMELKMLSSSNKT